MIIGESRQVVLVITSDDAIETVISRILKKRKMIITGDHRRVLMSLRPGPKASLDRRRTTTDDIDY